MQIAHGEERKGAEKNNEHLREKPGYKFKCAKGCGFMGWQEEHAEHTRNCTFVPQEPPRLPSHSFRGFGSDAKHRPY
jgi:hypothetical protein